ncbi:MAG: isochorismatase family protein [bacterium]
MRTELLDRARSVLVVVDVQERLMPAIHEAPRLLRRIELLAKAARALGVPAILTEQYPQGLGPTVAAVKAALPDGVEPVVKIDFSCAGVPAFAARGPEDRGVALRRIERGGVTVTTAEAVVFEWLRRAGTAEFKALQPLLKAID